MKRFELQAGNEVRGLRIRLYPTKEDEERLKILESDTRRAWNWLVKQTEEVLQARAAYAVRNGLVGPRPERPDYDGLEPEAARAAKEAHTANTVRWHHDVHVATSKLPECSFRKFKTLLEHYGDKFDYQMLSRIIDYAYEASEDARIVRPGAHMLQALTKNYFTKSDRRKKFRRASDPMPLQVRSTHCFKLGNFGSRGATHKNRIPQEPFYNCQIQFNGLKIRGRLPGKPPEGRVLEGVSIRKEADGWWASIKQEVPIRSLTPAIPGSVVGIDVGLDYMAAISEVRLNVPEAKSYSDLPVVEGHEKAVRVTNARSKSYAERIAGRQAQKLPVGRLQLQASRNNRHTIYNHIVKYLRDVETIKVEKLVATIGQMGSSKTSAMRTIVKLLTERYGNRVRAVQPHYTSQDCSQCQHRSKESWSYEHGRFGECPCCGYREDRDVNAARNIAFKSPISLES